MLPLPPIMAYHAAVASQGFTPDTAQEQAALVLQRCFERLLAGENVAVRGVYLWGPVGRGKTWLMDRFYQSVASSSRIAARRMHFHHFMRWVHGRLFALTGTVNPLQALAKELRAETQVLCFDELFVNDIGDAMLLGGLLQALFDKGLVVVATSNQPPDKLYADGFNRERFVPAIAAIERAMQSVCVDGGQDHRLHQGACLPRYWVTNGDAPSALAKAFEDYCAITVSADADAGVQPREFFELGHRQIPVVRRGSSALWFRYADLCQQSLSALDFIGLCDAVDALFISEVPNLSARPRAATIARGTEDGAERVVAGDRALPALSVHDDSVRRFIALVDECYDRRIPLYLEAAVPLDELYTDGYLGFAFRRTLSRLKEMQWQRFGRSS